MLVILSGEGFQSLDFNDANSNHSQDTESLEITQDIWGSRTATVPSPGSRVKATAVVKDRYFFKVCNTIKIDNVQRLTINQPFDFTIGAKLTLTNGSTFINSGYIIDTDTTSNRYVYVAVNNNEWTNDPNTGHLATERFDEQDTYGIRGPVPNDINVISKYTFAQVVNTTPGTFDIALGDYDAPPIVGGTNNLHEYSYFRPLQ